MYWVVNWQTHPDALYTVSKKGEHSFLLDTRIDTPQDINPRYLRRFRSW
jgi:hypothetical protein